MDLDYTIDFYMNDATRPSLAYTKQTLILNPAPPPPPPPPPPLPPPSPPAASPAKVSPAVSPQKQTSAHTPTPTPTPAPPVPVPAPAPPPNPNGTTPVQFLVDFGGNGIDAIPPGEPPRLYLHVDPPDTLVRESKVEKISYDNSWRASFTIIPYAHHVPIELHCRLMQNTKLPGDAKPLSEDWSYTWHQ